MTESISNSLKSLKAFSPQLNKLADEAAQVVRDVEKALDELNLGIGASVQVHSHNISKNCTEFISLEYRRIDGKFRIAIVKERETAFANENNIWDSALKTIDETPWLECGRDRKVETFEKLPELLETLIANAKKTVDGLQKNLPEVRKILESLK